MSQAANATSLSKEKLTTERISDGDVTCVRFQGVMDESFEGKRLASSVKSKLVVLDMGRVSKISSFGIREWSEFIGSVGRTAEHIYLIECTSKVMDQINMVAGFIGKARVISFYGPYRCDFCDLDRDVLFQVDRDQAAIRSFDPPEQLCETCARPQFFDEDPASYFSAVAQQPPFDLAGGISEFLAAKLQYNITGGNRRLQIDKHIEDQYTYLRLGGNLDGSFPSEKVADGLEGLVVVDVAGLGGVEIAGAAEWRNFITLARGGAKRIYLLDCPPVLLDRLPRSEDLADEVISFSMPYNCAQCSTTTSEIIDVEEHYQILKFATPPEMRCENCKQTTACAAQESLLSRLRDLPKPGADAKLKAFIKRARKRKPERQQVEEEVATGALGKRATGFIAFSLLGVLAASGGVLYYIKQQDSKLEALQKDLVVRGPATDKSDDKPDWVRGSHFAGFCSAQIQITTCVGVSSYRGTLEEAKQEARDVALAEASLSLAITFESELFDEKVRPLYSDARSSLVFAYDKLAEDREDPNYMRVYTRMSDARNRAGLALMASSNDAMPQQHSELYWEQYGEGTDKEFVVFMRFDINTDAIRRMGKIYMSEEVVAEATVMTAFPHLAWTFEDFSGGVLVTKAGGALKEGVIIGVGDTAVRSVAQLQRALEVGGEIAYATPAQVEALPDTPAP